MANTLLALWLEEESNALYRFITGRSKTAVIGAGAPGASLYY
jgi:hypothetical protein